MERSEPFVEANQKAGSDVLQGSFLVRDLYVSFDLTQAPYVIYFPSLTFTSFSVCGVLSLWYIPQVHILGHPRKHPRYLGSC